MPASDKLKVGDRVKIRNGIKIYSVEEVDRPSWEAAPPSTYVVRMVPEDGKGPEVRYGNAALVKIP